MDKRYVVAIVGRPNVGKSSLFNRMAGSSSSIVHKESGVTRDRLYGTVRWRGHEFTLLDTGGLDLSSRGDLQTNIRAQVEEALAEADALVFVVDLRAGLTAEDLDVAQVLRKTNKPLVLAANKADIAAHDSKAADFYELGFPDVFPISAAHGLGVGDLLDRLIEIADLGPSSQEPEEGDIPDIRVAIVGKPNVGKSSLVNGILGEGRMTVSTVPGTTVDAVDTPFQWRDRRFVLVDTAGLRRPKTIGEKLEELSVGRALSAVKRSDVSILVLDGTQRPTTQERRIAGFIRRNRKASVIVVNKVDLGLWGEVLREQYSAAALYECRPIDYSEVAFVSALTGEGLEGILPLVAKAYDEYGKRIDTSLLNRALGEMTAISPPPRAVRFFYGTQVGRRPPHMVFFAKGKDSVSAMYLRYMEGEMRRRFGFVGSPIVMGIEERQRRSGR